MSKFQAPSQGYRLLWMDSVDVVILNCMCCLCQDAFSLLAYSDPASSPVSYQL